MKERRKTEAKAETSIRHHLPTSMTVAQVVEAIDSWGERAPESFRQLYDMMTALRGPDLSWENGGKLKKTSTAVIRRGMFPKSLGENGGFATVAQAGDYFTAPQQYDDDFAEISFRRGHFAHHARLAFEALRAAGMLNDDGSVK